ncbi:MAG: tol-pal system-associated acyl-CoA thioesterase [Steroidobacteraceae bacterium]
MSEFCWPVRVYYEDTDAGGVVYHASYLRYFERGRTEWLRAQGCSQAQLIKEQAVVFTVVSLDIQYHKPARLDELLQVVTQPKVAGGASLEFEQQLQRDDGHVLARGKALVACVDATSFKPRRLPAALRMRIP